MDMIVEQALIKWPNVPHCFGWLGLDARGAWRMQAPQNSEKPACGIQTKKLPSEKIRHPVLLDFINRNYTHDAQGRWYFQNGPQRVYIDLESTPYIARTDPAGHFSLHTGAQMTCVETVWLSEQGKVYLQQKDTVALLDDRDMAQWLTRVYMDGSIINDEHLLAWLDKPIDEAISFQWQGRSISIKPIFEQGVAAHFGFIRLPRRANSSSATFT
tara:strand:+ start:647292 stop:647933 length:642 start_codon:yes stop_codon:yes gene_type:complete